MSAYIVNPDHIKALAIFAAGSSILYRTKHRVDPCYLKYRVQDLTERKLIAALENSSVDDVAQFYADILYNENIKSVSARHSGSFEDLPGMTDKSKRVVIKSTDFPNSVTDPTWILKMCDGLEYQSCETDTWYNSLAYILLTAIRKAAVDVLPGYEDAPWEYSKESYA